MQHHDHQMSSREVLLTKIPLFFHHLQQLAKTFHRIPDEWQPLASPSFEPTSLNIQSTFTPENSELLSMIAFSSSPGPLRYDSEPSKFLGSSHQKKYSNTTLSESIWIHNQIRIIRINTKYINPYTCIYIYNSKFNTKTTYIMNHDYILCINLCTNYKSVMSITKTRPVIPSTRAHHVVDFWCFRTSTGVPWNLGFFQHGEMTCVFFITQKMLLHVMQYNI